ncbi:hypothetical protein Tco_0363823 [Tanacetum coccineum]
MSVRQVWKRKTPLPKSSPTCHNDSPPPPSRNTPHSISPPMNYPQRDRIINQLHTISTLIDSQTPTPTSPPHPLVQPPTNAQVGCHASFCHCCRCSNYVLTTVLEDIQQGMLIPDAFLTDEIRTTDDYVEYETVFMKIKKRKSVAGETSSPRKSLKVTIKQRKQSTTPIPLLSDDKEMDEIAEATLLSLTLHKTAIAAEAQENVAKVQEKLKEGGINKMVEGVDN